MTFGVAWNLFTILWVTYWSIRTTRKLIKQGQRDQDLMRLSHTAFRQAADNYVLRIQLINAGIEPIDLDADEHQAR